MAQINFPPNPVDGQVFTSGARRWRWEASTPRWRALVVASDDPDEDAPPVGAFGGHVLIVDDANGNDTTGGYTTGPYKTIKAALDDADDGTTVVVMPGYYTQTGAQCPLLAGEGRNLHFMPGAKLDITMTGTSGYTALFADGVYSVTGDGEFAIGDGEAAGYDLAFFRSLDDLTDVMIECRSVSVQIPGDPSSRVAFDAHDCAKARIVVKQSITCIPGDAVHVGADSGPVTLDCDLIVASYRAIRTQSVEGGGGSVFNVARINSADGYSISGHISVAGGTTVRVGAMNFNLWEDGSSTLLEAGPGSAVFVDKLTAGPLTLGGSQAGGSITIREAKVDRIDINTSGQVIRDSYFLCKENYSFYSEVVPNYIDLLNVRASSPAHSTVTVRNGVLNTWDDFVMLRERIPESGWGGEPFYATIPVSGYGVSGTFSAILRMEHKILGYLGGTKDIGPFFFDSSGALGTTLNILLDTLAADPDVARNFRIYSEGGEAKLESKIGMTDPDGALTFIFSYGGSPLTIGFVGGVEPNSDFATPAAFRGQLCIAGNYPGPYRTFVARDKGITDWIETTRGGGSGTGGSTAAVLGYSFPVQPGESYYIANEGGREIRYYGDRHSAYGLSDDPASDFSGIFVDNEFFSATGRLTPDYESRNGWPHYVDPTYLLSEDPNVLRMVYVPAGDTTYDAGHASKRWIILENGVIEDYALMSGAVVSPWHVSLVWNLGTVVTRSPQSSVFNWEVIKETYELMASVGPDSATDYVLKINGIPLSYGTPVSLGFVDAESIPNIVYASSTSNTGDDYLADDLLAYVIRRNLTPSVGDPQNPVIVYPLVKDFFSTFKVPRRRFLHILLGYD